VKGDEGGVGALGEIRTPDPRNRKEWVSAHLGLILQALGNSGLIALGFFLGFRAH